jgi:23S rRNA pseudouridine1911/1915/1917 synthase
MLDDLDPLDEDEPTPEILTATKSGGRLDKWLAERLSGRSRAEVQRWIDAGLVTLAGRPVKASHQVGAGDAFSVVVLPPADYPVAPEPIPLDLVYEDADLLVIDKPAGLVVHPAAGNWTGTLVNAVMYHCPDMAGVGAAGRPGIVHRLDKDTSGLILVAKNDATHRALQAQFKDRTVSKSYDALVYGRVAQPRGLIEAVVPRRRATKSKRTTGRAPWRNRATCATHCCAATR